jgi:hypothetical protein
VDGYGSDVSALPGPTFRLSLTALCGESALPLNSDLQQSKLNIHQSSILPPNTPMATSGPTAAGQPYRGKNQSNQPQNAQKAQK